MHFNVVITRKLLVKRYFFVKESWNKANMCFSDALNGYFLQ